MRNKAVIITAGVCLVLFLSALGIVVWQYSKEPSTEIEILLDGKTIYSGSTVHAGTPLYVDAVGKEFTNHIRIDEIGVTVESSTCPNGECVRMGYLQNRSLPIVCLPNNLVIRYTDNSDSQGGALDAVSQ